MPVPLPSPAAALLAPPDAAEVQFFTRGLVSAASPGSGLTATQDLLMRAIARAMTGYPAADSVEAIDPEQFARGLAPRTLDFRTRIVQLMVLMALVLRPLPPEVVERVSAFARELQVDESMLEVAGRFASGCLGLAAVDFQRNGYTADWHPEDMQALHTSRELSDAWEAAVADPDLAARWAALEELPPGTLGRRVTEFYRSRGFVYPGRPGSAPPLLAQHDWAHVVADYGTSVESELEVFAFIARANDDMRAFSLLAMVVSLFETGYLRTGAGLFEASPGHLSERGMATRVADAMRRGALCNGSIDFLRIDWFELAPLDLVEVRDHFGLVEKGQEAREAGSMGPWEPGGISRFQRNAGQALAAAEGRPYESYGAEPAS